MQQALSADVLAVQPTAGDVLELTMWCQRLAAMVHRCSQPQALMQDIRALVQQQALRMEALEVAMEENFKLLESRMVRLERGWDGSSMASDFEDELGRIPETQDSKLGKTIFQTQAPRGGAAFAGDMGEVDDAVGNSRREPRGARVLQRTSKTSSFIKPSNVPASPGDVQMEFESPAKGATLSWQLDEEGFAMDEDGPERTLSQRQKDRKGTADSTGSASTVVFSQEDRLAHLEDALERLSHDTKTANEDIRKTVKWNTESFSNAPSSRAEDHFISLEYEVKESIWDAAMLGFFSWPSHLNIGGYTDKAALLVTFATNLGMQITLITVIYLGMLDLQQEIEAPELLGEYREMLATQGYRMVEGEDGGMENKSMPELFCEIGLWSYEQDVYEDMWRWTRPAFSFSQNEIPGPWLTFLGLTVWVCSVFSDYEAMTMHMRGILGMPLSVISEIAMNSENGFRIEGVNCLTRSLMFILIIAPRLGINIGLLYVGCKYIVITYKFSDIVLNCVALMFVLEMDETLHNVFLPKSIRKAMESFDPIQVKRYNLFEALEAGDVVRWLLMMMVLVLSYNTLLIPAMESIAESVNQLCPEETVVTAGLR